MYKPSKRGAGSRKQAASKIDETATRLTHWAQVKMGHSKNQLLSSDEMKMLLGSGVGSSMWQYIVTHINRPSNVQLVRKNIQLHSVDITGKRCQLLTERAELSRELTSLRLAMTQLESDLSRLHGDIARMADVKGLTEEEVREWSRKYHLLSAHSFKCQEMVNIINEFSKRIRYRTEVLSHQSKEKSYFAKANKGSLQLESACKHDVSSSCDDVRSLLVQLVREEVVGGATEEQSRQTKKQIWSKLESLLSVYSPAELMQCLCELTREASGHVSTATADVDLGRDAKLLRYHYDCSAGVKDDMTRANLLKSVEDHLMLLQLSHLHRSVECEHHLASAADARDKLSLLKAQVDWHFSEAHHSDSAVADIFRAAFHHQLELSGCEAALSTLTQVCSQLSSVRDQKRLVLNQLQDKKRQIDQFTLIADEKQSMIESLIKANSVAWSRLQKQQQELDLFIRTKVLLHQSHLLPMAAALHDSVNFELQHFSHLSLARMMQTPSSPRPRVSVTDLSIHRPCNAHTSRLPHWAELVEIMGVAWYGSPERIVSRLSFLLERVEVLKNLAKGNETALEEVRGCCTKSFPAKGVLLASKRCDRQQEEIGVLALQDSLSLASQGLARCSTVQQTLQEWWEQPTQLCGHWITYEGMNMEKWLEQWRVLSARLHQLSSHSPVATQPKALQNT